MGVPSHPTQLEEHDLIYCWPHQHWQLSGRDKQAICIKRTPRLCIDQTQAAVRAAQRHLGIVNAPQHYVHPFLQDGQLVPVLPDWQSGKRPFYMLHCQPRFTRCVLRCSPISSRSTPSAIVPASRTINFHRRSRCTLHLTADDPHLAQSSLHRSANTI